jgi:phage major head subunit gpT-like protein
MPYQRNAFPLQMDREIDDMFHDRLQNYPSEYQMVANISRMPKGRRYVAAEISGLGNVKVIEEGGRVTFDTPAEGHRKEVEATQYGLGYQVTEISIEDDYHGKVVAVASTLSDAMEDKVNVEFFSLYNDGNDTHQSWDSKYIFADDHTTLKSGDTIDNLGAAALSETSLQAAFEYFDKLVDEAGRKIRVEPDYLLVPTELRWMAGRLSRQTGGYTDNTDNKPTLGMNDMTTNSSNGYVGGYQVHICRYLTDAESWWLGSKKDHQMNLMWKRDITLESADDFHTGNRLYKVTSRFVTACFDYKPVYGAYV